MEQEEYTVYERRRINKKSGKSVLQTSLTENGGPEGDRTLDLTDANRTLSQTELRAQITVWSGNSTRNEYEIISKRPCGQKLHTVRSQLSYEPDNRKHYIILCFLVKYVFLKL